MSSEPLHGSHCPLNEVFQFPLVLSSSFQEHPLQLEYLSWNQRFSSNRIEQIQKREKERKKKGKKQGRGKDKKEEILS